MAREITVQNGRETQTVIADIRERLSRSPEAGAIIGFLAVAVFFIITTAIDTPDGFPQILTARSVSSVMSNNISLGILAVGVTILMIAGEFDLSVGSMLGLSALIFIISADSGFGGLAEMLLPPETVRAMGLSYEGFPGLIAMAVALVAGGIMGTINGFLLISTRIPSFIVTLGTLYIYRAIMYNIIPGGTIARFEREPIMAQFHPIVLSALGIFLWAIVAFFAWPIIQTNLRRLRRPEAGKITASLRLIIIGISLIAGAIIVLNMIFSLEDFNTIVEIDLFDILNGRLLLLPGNYLTGIVWWFLLVVIFQVVLTQSPFGNAVFATGGNPAAALAQGIRVKRVKLTAFILSGMLSAVGGMMEVARFKVVEPLRGTGYELDVIAAAVIGGTLLTGGYGSIIGALLGVLISGILKTGLVLIGIDATWYRGVLGLIMIIAVIINTNVRRQR